MRKPILLIFALLSVLPALSIERQRLNFNSSWLINIGDTPEAAEPGFDDSEWSMVTLPHAFNEDEAFKVSIENLTDTIIWYRKHFDTANRQGRKFFIEFEGVRFGADVWLNGKKVGYSDNGVMAFGFDLTPYIVQGENVIAVRCDNSWNYHERTTGSTFQWNDRNFNANYGGIVKNVWLHITDKLYQTLPLYSSLGTTGTYIYGTDYDIPGKTVTVNAESQVRNDDSIPRSFTFFCKVLDNDGREVGHFDGNHYTLQPGETRTVAVSGKLHNAHFWSWGYGYLYTVKTLLKADDGSKIDDRIQRTGFRKTHFGNGMIQLNDRVMMVHGYAQRTTNEWPGLGTDVPAWLSDYSNHLIVESGGNMVRWMHVCPSKQDIESCDRAGLPEAMPAGDAENDVGGRQWEQRVEVMRDAIIYNRNNPSILFYECGNKGITREHMTEMKAVRDEFDPHGGRAIGCREMLDIDEAEYGGEMLYINKSARKPMWAMEYCRDEGLRKYWDDYSYPYHKEGAGPPYRGKPALEYNHNQDEMAKELVRRWNDYYLVRPGTGKRVSGGGVKIVFSDTNTHHRGEKNYRTSGVVDAMRLPKDGFFAHQVMWDGWVEPEQAHTYIVGHWNYPVGTVKPVYVVSNGDSVSLTVNGKDQGHAVRSDTYLFTFPNVRFEEGCLEAVSYKSGHETSRYSIGTAGKPDHLKLTTIGNPLGFKADGSDVVLIQVEVVDKEGRRCPLDNRLVTFKQWGEGEWIGGIGSKNTSDNYIRSLTLPVECGVNRVIVRSTPVAGTIHISAVADSLKPVCLDIQTNGIDVEHYEADMLLPCRLDRGETPNGLSYRDINEEIPIVSAVAGSNASDAANSFDDNERTEWRSDGNEENAWITYKLARRTTIDEITLKLTGWRSLRYPITVYEDSTKVWEGLTEPTLGYVHINIGKAVPANTVRIVMRGPAAKKEEKGDTNELAGGKASKMDRVSTAKGKVRLRIVEIDMLHKR